MRISICGSLFGNFFHKLHLFNKVKLAPAVHRQLYRHKSCDHWEQLSMSLKFWDKSSLFFAPHDDKSVWIKVSYICHFG